MLTPTLSDAMDRFLVDRIAVGVSNATIKHYLYVFKPLASKWGKLPIDQIDVTIIREYLAALRSQTTRYHGAKHRREQPGGLSDATIRSRIRALQVLFRWCKREFNLPSNPMDRVRLPPAKRQQPKAIALEDLRKLLEAANPDRPGKLGIMGKRDRALLAFLADTGCRASGALTLIPANLFLEQGRAIVSEKGDRVRAVPFTRYTALLIHDWMEVRPPAAATVFCSLWERHHAQQMTLSGLWYVIRRLKARAGITGRCNPHSFRHGFARSYLEHGGDLATLAQLMGHSNVTVTAQFYAVFTDPELAQRHEQFSPLRDIQRR